MRRTIPFAVMAAMALVSVDHVIAGNGAGLIGAKTSYPSAGIAKGDRLPLGQAPTTEHSVATVEVIGLDQAAVVYKDSGGHELFRTDSLANSTIVARGFSVPVVTVRENAASPVRPVVVDPKIAAGQSPVAASPAVPTPAPEQKLPRGCEAAASPLSSAASSRLHARCVA